MRSRSGWGGGRRPDREPAALRHARQAIAADADVTYVCVDGGKHAMLRRHDLFDGRAADFASSTLLGTPPSEPLARVLAAGPFSRP